MRILLLIPSVLKPEIADGPHPRMDYHALAAALRRSGDTCDLVGYAEAGSQSDTKLAAYGFAKRREYDAIFTNGENVGIPLGLLLKASGGRRPRHVTIGHRLSTGKKQLFFRRLNVHAQMDTIFVYAETQRSHAVSNLRIPAERVRQIAFHADADFYRPTPTTTETLISSAGLEWRDYPTLIEAVKSMPDLTVKLAAASPWSKHANETENRTLPPNVSARRYDYAGLRDLYAASLFVVVPLYENDFQAGVTTLLEAMAMGKAVIVTRTTGQTDVVIDGENGLTVPPGDAAAWRKAITRLREDDELRERLERNARRWIEENATLDRWVDQIVSALKQPSRSATATS